MDLLKFPTAITRLIQSYLQHRTFHVTVNADRSDTRKIANGTPQGSILGPVLFLIYVNDIPKPGRPLIAQYADDTAAYFRAGDLPTLAAHLQRTLDALLAYFHRWRIKINPLKTEAVLFTHRSLRSASDHPLRIGLQPLPWQTTAKFLGVTLDRRLIFSRHIDNVTRTARAAMAVLYPLITRSSKLSTPIKVRLAAAYVRPILTYAAPAWTGTASDTNLLRLQVIQNKCLRMALNLPPWTPIRDLHKEAKIPHLGDTILRMTDKFYEKTKTSDNPYIRALGDYTPETLPYTPRHKTPKHRIFQRDA